MIHLHIYTFMRVMSRGNYTEDRGNWGDLVNLR